MIKKLPFIIIAWLALVGGCKSHGAELPQKFLNAEIQVESSGRDNAVGDNGRAIGCLQIHRTCWEDARQFDSSLGNYQNYSNCFNREYSCRVMSAYLHRYCPDAIRNNDFETMARVWNGGSNGRNSTRTLDYWRKVKAALKN